jgi:hypothetical protein
MYEKAAKSELYVLEKAARSKWKKSRRHRHLESLRLISL